MKTTWLVEGANGFAKGTVERIVLPRPSPGANRDAIRHTREISRRDSEVACGRIER